jgi:hypothetical protein
MASQGRLAGLGQGGGSFEAQTLIISSQARSHWKPPISLKLNPVFVLVRIGHVVVCSVVTCCYPSSRMMIRFGRLLLLLEFVLTMLLFVKDVSIGRMRPSRKVDSLHFLTMRVGLIAFVKAIPMLTVSVLLLMMTTR